MTQPTVYEYVVLRCGNSSCLKKIRLSNFRVSKNEPAIKWSCPSCGMQEKELPIQVLLNRVIDQQVAYRENEESGINPGILRAMLNVRVVDAATYESNFPHTFRVLQNFTMALAKLRKNRGKTGLFGADKSIKAEQAFENEVSRILIALRTDGEITAEANITDVQSVLTIHFEKFVSVYPNWSDAEIEYRELCMRGDIDRLISRYR